MVAEKLCFGDLAAMPAGDGGASAEIVVRRANLEIEKYFSNEQRKAFDWPIHPEGVSARVPGVGKAAGLYFEAGAAEITLLLPDSDFLIRGVKRRPSPADL
jgi:hypothetical protein